MPRNLQEETQRKEEIGYQYVHNNIFHVLGKLSDRLPKHGPIVVYGIPRGGLVPAVIISHALEKSRQVRLVTSLDHLDPGDWHRLVIVDELVDSGDTIKSLKTRFPESITVAIYQRYTAKFSADIVGRLVDNDNWLVFPWEKV